MKEIKYPFLPEGQIIEYVGIDNIFMEEAKRVQEELSTDLKHSTGSVVVKNGLILGRGANGSNYHFIYDCERKKRNIPTGQGYELCEGCHPKNHSEPKAIQNALANGHGTAGADLYLYGHWWCCEPCWKAIIESGISNVFLLEGSERHFNKDHPENIIGK